MNTIHCLLNDVLDDLDALLVQLVPDAYDRPLPVLSGATLGQHVRHVLEGYRALAESLASGQLDYDRRPRDRNLETSVPLARAALQAVRNTFAQTPPEQVLFLHQGSGLSAPVVVATSVGRELLHTIEHTIHHMALLRIAVEQALPAVSLPSHFGVAYATRQHRQAA
jgi:uncharacterized damage-inducible protein DinB